MKSIYALTTLIALTLAACGDPGSPDPEPADPEGVDGGLAAAEAQLDELERAAPVVQHNESALICGGEDWQNLLAFQFDPEYRVGVNYGTAVARLDGDDHRCTGFLYNGRYLLTAEHCRDGFSSLKATFGRFPGSTQWARDRLVDMGLSPFVAATFSNRDLTEWNCRFRDHFDRDADGDRDIALYRCDAKSFGELGAVWPADIWGHMRLDPGHRNEGTDVYVVSDNEPSWSNGTRLLLSPDGDVTDRYDSDCYPFSGHDQCFEHDADTLGGSSGGPILLGHNHRVLGLVMGNFGLNNDCPVGSTNYGTYVVDEDELRWDNPWFSSLPANPQPAWSGWAGGHGGTARRLSCPDDYLAVGVVGTTGTGGNPYVGNLGLVCAPFQKYTSQASRSTVHWKVLVGGSIDTLFVSGMFDYNTYVNEMLDLTRDGGGLASFADQQQSVTVCRPGHYMVGLRMRAGRFIDKVEAVECARHDGRAFRARSLRKPIGTSNGGVARRINCPHTNGNANHGLPDRAVDGLFIRSGWLTDGLQLSCRTYR